MPETKLPAVGARIMGLDDPTKKMSKSETGSGHSIGLLEEPSAIRKKIMRATTDSLPAVDFKSMGPGVANLLTIHQAFTGWTDDQVKAHFAGMRYGDLKKTVAEAVLAGLEPIQTRYREITSDPGYLDGVLREAADRVRPLAADTVRKVKERMGIYTA
jgi:tryptophanyl-tRNA synthetase